MPTAGLNHRRDATFLKFCPLRKLLKRTDV